jgi:hypothetical protein
MLRIVWRGPVPNDEPEVVVGGGPIAALSPAKPEAAR